MAAKEWPPHLQPVSPAAPTMSDAAQSEVATSTQLAERPLRADKQKQADVRQMLAAYRPGMWIAGAWRR